MVYCGGGECSSADGPKCADGAWRQFELSFRNRVVRNLLLLLMTTIATCVLPTAANAIPIFARQTQQNCVACHVGGQYPELTPYGRYFKMTGFNQGAKQGTDDGWAIPVAMSMQFGVNRIKNNNADGNPAAAKGPSSFRVESNCENRWSS